MAMIDRQARDLPLDAHLHTDLSHDSAEPIDGYAGWRSSAASRSSPSPTTSTSRPARPAFGETTFEQRERIVREAAERWAERGVAIRFGVEITWDSHYATEIRDHLANNAYDFVIGSVHIYRGSQYAADNVAGWVAGRSMRGDRGALLRRGDRRRPNRIVRRDGPHRLREAFPGARMSPPRTSRRHPSCTSRSWPRSSRAARPSRSTPAGCAHRPRRRSPLRPSWLASTRWGTRRDGRLGCAHGRFVRVGARGRVRVCGRGRILVAGLPSWRRPS